MTGLCQKETRRVFKTLRVCADLLPRLPAPAAQARRSGNARPLSSSAASVFVISPTLLLAAAAVLTLCGATFLAVLLRQGRPRDGAGIAGVALSGALLGTAALLVWLASAAPAPGPRPGEPRVGADGLGGALGGLPALREGEANAPAPEIAYTALDGTAKTLSALRGRVVLVNLWATWCGPCVREMPDLARLAARYDALGLTVVALSDEPADLVRPFAERTGTTALVGLADLGALPDPYARASSTRPVTFLIGRDGRLLKMVVGAQTFEAFEALAADALQPTLAARLTRLR